MFISFQAKGTTGREILDGIKQVEILDKIISIRAKVKSIPGYSAHADQEMLRNWIDRIKRPIKRVFVVQGEKEAAESLAQIIKDQLGISASVPKLNEVVEL
ncbi:hypothetical protein ES703_83886 [subsurface metagenome]